MTPEFIYKVRRYGRFLRHIMRAIPKDKLLALHATHTSNINPSASWRDACIAIQAKIAARNHA